MNIPDLIVFGAACIVGFKIGEYLLDRIVEWNVGRMLRKCRLKTLKDMEFVEFENVDDMESYFEKREVGERIARSSIAGAKAGIEKFKAKEEEE